ncbi:MAG: TolC family protein [Opitutus sp.]|nr:TolC family protein [Opitutus sp.]
MRIPFFTVAVTIQSEGEPCAPRAAISTDATKAARGAHGPPFGFRSVEGERVQPNGNDLARRVRGGIDWGRTALLGACAAAALHAADQPTPPGGTIDLPTALRLVGASNLDVEIAREKVTEARAANDSARARYFPWITPSIGIRRHDNNAQAVNGPIIDADKQSLSLGVALNAQLDLGETYFQNLVARQLIRSSEAALAGRQHEAAYRAATGYFDLTRARAAVIAAEEAARVSGRHAEQIAATAEAGLTFQGDATRVRAVRERAELTLIRARTDQRIAAVRLAEILRLDPAVELTPVDADLAPMSVVNAGEELGTLVSRALAKRPELDEAAARLEVARTHHRAAKQGPLIPTVGAQISLGALGGGPGSTSIGHDFDSSNDYGIGVSWRIGPGGLFDRNRQRETASRERQVSLEQEKMRDVIRRQVVEQHTRLRSLAAQIDLARKTLDAADQTAKLSRQRRETGVSAVLEDVQAEDELARARRDYLVTVADYNHAQYALRFAIGE